MSKSDVLELSSILRSCIILHEFSSNKPLFTLFATKYIQELFPDVTPRSEMIYTWSPADSSRLHLFGYEESHHNGSVYDRVYASVIVTLKIAQEIGQQIQDRALSFARQQLLDEEKRAKEDKLQATAESVLRGLLN